MKRTPVFGEDRICPNCGALTQERRRFSVTMGAKQNDAYAIEYCENCAPTTVWGMLFDAAMKPGEWRYDGKG
jgi:hypothetical protein